MALPLATHALDHEEWHENRFGAVPKLPRLAVVAPTCGGVTAGSTAVAGRGLWLHHRHSGKICHYRMGDASLPTESLPQQSRTGRRSATRPKKKAAFVTGTPISAATREVEPCGGRLLSRAARPQFGRA